MHEAVEVLNPSEDEIESDLLAVQRGQKGDGVVAMFLECGV